MSKQSGQRGRTRIRRVVQDLMLALLVVLAVFGFAAWESRAHAFSAALVQSLQTRSPNTSPIVMARLAGPDPWQTASTPPAPEAPAFPKQPFPQEIGLTGPDRSEALAPSSQRRATEFAMEDQIFWRYAGRNADQLPWFVAEQKKKRAVMTGRPLFLMLAIVFAIMSALTMGLWRQIPGTTRNRGLAAKSARRLS